MVPIETPGHVLQEYRLTIKDANQREFAEDEIKRAWTEDVQRRLEDGNTRFKQWHLETLVNRARLQRGSVWYRRFEAAMVGDEWPPVRDRVEISLDSSGSVGEPESVLVPVNLKGKSGRFKLILELVLGFMLALGGALWFITAFGYSFWEFTKEKMVQTLPTEPMMIGGGGNCTLNGSVRISLPPTGDSYWSVGDMVEIDVWASSYCTFASKVRVDGKLIAWSANRREVIKGVWEHRVGYFWDTSGYAPGEHTISVEFLSPLSRLSRITIQTRIVTLVGKK